MTIVPVVAATAAAVVLIPPARRRVLAVAGTTANATFSTGVAVVGGAVGAVKGIATTAAEGAIEIGRVAVHGASSAEQAG